MPQLPIHEHAYALLDALKAGNRLILKAPTGSGKSTQVPQILLDSGIFFGTCLILQPRRLAARMLAQRVAEERESELGDCVGYQTRFESKVSAQTRICYITEGILPRKLQSNRTLEGVDVVIFDEFHERNLATDIGLALVCDLQRQCRPDLRIIVMSATIDTAPLAAYLNDAPVIASDGRMFPVDVRNVHTPPAIPVWDAATQAVRSLITEKANGDILVFMPGVYEIRRTAQAIESSVHNEPLTVLTLYGDLPAHKQHQVMEQCSKRKIIVATNIAETSLTIPGIRHVVDSGLARINRYDPARGFNTLFTEPISIDAADQRAGRAGREAPGICIRLWSVAQHAGRSRNTTPEIIRVDLSETLLCIKRLGYTHPDTFPWFDAPPPAALTAAQELLTLLGALTINGALTDTGIAMGNFPMHPRLARLLMEAGKRNALHCAAFSAALLSERPILAGKPDFPEEAHHADVASDLYGYYCIFHKAHASGFDPAVCLRLHINMSAAKAVERTFALFMQLCKRMGMHGSDAADAPSSLALCMLLAYPDHLAARKDKGTLMCALRDSRHGELAPDSITRSATCVVAADIREIKDRNQKKKTMLTMAAEIKKEWLHEYFPDNWETRPLLEWNSLNKSVECRIQTLCLGVVVEEQPQSCADVPEASDLLAETILTKELVLPMWNDAVRDWINRARWVAGMFPEQKLLQWNDDDRRMVVHVLCEGEYRYARAAEKPVLPILMEMLSLQQLRFIDTVAPQTIMLPSNRKMRITYEPNALPRGRARIQELYGLKQSPRIAENRIAVPIEILAPNNRPVQITDDLERFWIEHYPELKKSLSRRYPKHEWR